MTYNGPAFPFSRLLNSGLRTGFARSRSRRTVRKARQRLNFELASHECRQLDHIVVAMVSTGWSALAEPGPKPSEEVPTPPLLDNRHQAQAGPPSHNELATRLRGFGPLGILAILFVLFPTTIAAGGVGGMPILVPFGAIKALVWARLSRTPWHEIGYVRPKNWTASLAIGAALGVAFKFLMKALVMPFLGADPINHAYHFLAGNRAALPAAVWSMIVSGGLGEEILFRGYLFERLGKLFGPSIRATALVVLITSLGFGLLHYPEQGLAGAEQATITGLVFGTIFAVTGRLAMPMCAHAAFDLTAVAMIYWNQETKVAHLLFR